MDVARALVGAPPPRARSSVEEEWRAIDPNIPPDVLQRIVERTTRRRQAPEQIEVLWWNLPAVNVFRLCQWERITAGGGMAADRILVSGIAATEIRAVAEALAVPFDADLLDRVRVMEGAARQVLNER